MAVSKLSDLPNVGKVLEKNLMAAGIETPEQLQAVGAREAFLRIRLKSDPGACLHMLYGIQGAILGIPDRMLSSEEKEDLKAFFKNL